MKEITNAESAAKEIPGLVITEEIPGLVITEEIQFKGARFFFVRTTNNNVIEFHQPASL